MPKWARSAYWYTHKRWSRFKTWVRGGDWREEELEWRKQQGIRTVVGWEYQQGGREEGFFSYADKDLPPMMPLSEEAASSTESSVAYMDMEMSIYKFPSVPPPSRLMTFEVEKIPPPPEGMEEKRRKNQREMRRRREQQLQERHEMLDIWERRQQQQQQQQQHGMEQLEMWEMQEMQEMQQQQQPMPGLRRQIKWSDDLDRIDKF